MWPTFPLIFRLGRTLVGDFDVSRRDIIESNQRFHPKTRNMKPKCKKLMGDAKNHLFRKFFTFFQKLFCWKPTVWSLGLYIPYFCDSRAPRGWFWRNSTRSKGLKSGIHRKKVVFWSPILKMKKKYFGGFFKKNEKNPKKYFFRHFRYWGPIFHFFRNIPDVNPSDLVELRQNHPLRPPESKKIRNIWAKWGKNAVFHRKSQKLTLGRKT